MSRISDFKERFNDFDIGVVDSLFPILDPLVPAYYGGDYDASALEKEIILNLLAHLMTIESKKTTGSVRNESSKSVGNVSVSYEASQTEAGRLGFFNTTRYGQTFLYLISSCEGAKFV